MVALWKISQIDIDSYFFILHYLYIIFDSSYMFKKKKQTHKKVDLQQEVNEITITNDTVDSKVPE